MMKAVMYPLSSSARMEVIATLSEIKAETNSDADTKILTDFKNILPGSYQVEIRFDLN